MAKYRITSIPPSFFKKMNKGGNPARATSKPAGIMAMEKLVNAPKTKPGEINLAVPDFNKEIQKIAQNKDLHRCPPNHYWNGRACVKIEKSTYTPIDPNYLAQNPDIAPVIVNKPEVTISRKASDIAKFRDEWKKKNPRDQWLDEKKRYYLDVLSNPGLNKMAGVNMSNFPSNVRQNYLNEYEYLANTYAIDKIADKRGFDPDDRGEWIDQLSEGELRALAESKYSSQLQPSYWARSRAGLQELGNFVLKTNPISALAGVDYDLLQYNIPGLTKREQKEIAESPFGGLETFSFIDIPGAALANYTNNAGLSTGSDYKELPGFWSGKKMANVSDLQATLFNPITYFGIESLPELGINALRGLARGTGSAYRGIRNLVTKGDEAAIATENLVKGLSESHPTSIDELTNTGFRNDPNYHLERFNEKKQEIIRNLKTPEGRRRLQTYIDNSPMYMGKTPEAVIDDLEKVEFVTTRPYFRDPHNLNPFFEQQMDELIAAGELDPSAKQQYMGYVIGKDGQRYTKFKVDPNNAFNWYLDGTNNPSIMSMGQNFTPYDAQHILEHEFQHFFQRGFLSEADEILKDLELIDEVALDQPTFLEVLNRYNPFKKEYQDLGVSASGDIYKTGFKNPKRKEGLVNQKNYWSFGGRGQEKSAFLAEIRENMLQRGIIKNRYDKITPEMLKEHYRIYKNTKGDKYFLRTYDVMKNNKKNFEILSRAINKLPAVLPIGIGVGAAGAAAAGSSNGGDETNYKKGGSIQLELSDAEIQDYIKRGYVIEEVVPKMSSGGKVVSELWTEITGTPWKEAKARGLTTGSFDENIALRNRLLAGEFGKINDVVSPKTSYDVTIEQLVKKGKTLDDLVAMKAGTRSGLKSRFPELFDEDTKPVIQDQNPISSQLISNQKNPKRGLNIKQLKLESPKLGTYHLTKNWWDPYSDFGKPKKENKSEKKENKSEKKDANTFYKNLGVEVTTSDVERMKKDPVIKDMFDRMEANNKKLRTTENKPLSGSTMPLGPMAMDYSKMDFSKGKNNMLLPPGTPLTPAEKLWASVENLWDSIPKSKEEILETPWGQYGAKKILDLGILSKEQEQQLRRKLEKEGVIDTPDSKIKLNKEKEAKIKLPKVKPKVDKFYQEVATVEDSYDSDNTLLSYRNQWNNNEGFVYYATPVKKDRSENDEYSNVKGVGHFLLDASASQSKPYTHKHNKALIERAKRNNDYVPVFTSEKGDYVRLKYKRANDLRKGDKVITPLRQMKFDEIDFSQTQTPVGFKRGINEVKRKNGEGTYLLFKDRDGYSRFSGGSVVFIFNDEFGNTIVRDFAGSLNQIENEGLQIKKRYQLEDNDLVIGYHDVGAFSAKIKANSDNKLKAKQWEGFHNEDYTGGALLIPQ